MTSTSLRRPAALLAVLASLGLAGPSHPTAAAGAGPAAVAGSTDAPARSAAADRALSLDDVLAIRHPSAAAWSPAGDRLAFLWNDGGREQLWWVAADAGPEGAGGGAAAATGPSPIAGHDSEREEGGVGGFDWHPDGSGLAYTEDGRLWLHDLERHGREPVPVSAGTAGAVTEAGPATADPAFSPDGTRLAFVAAGEVWLADVATDPSLAARAVRRLSSWGGDASTPRWSPDGRHLLVGVTFPRRLREDAAELLGGKLEAFRREAAGADLAVLSVADARTVWLERGDAVVGQGTWSDEGTVAWQEVSADATRRRILVARPPASAEGPAWAGRVVVDETDPAWWSLTYLEAGPRWEPGGRRLTFVSDRDGWAHVYVAELAEAKGETASGEPSAGTLPWPEDPAAARQLTRGEFEVESPRWHPDGGRLVLAANRGSATERHLFVIDLATADPGSPPELRPISRLRGTSTEPLWSPDGTRIAFLHADFRRPLDLWVRRPDGGRARQLTDSWPAEAPAAELAVPQAVRFPSSDGTPVPGHLFYPPESAARDDGPVPGIVWIHGGGIRQNRLGWHPMRGYAVYYSFHQYLLQRGYAVLAVDYRGSIGYGRAFRVAPHHDLGGGDLDDVLAAGRSLRGLDDLEVGRVGVWGISYGGYLTLRALTAAPTAFDAGVDVAGVVDWEDWHRDPGGLWIEGRMGDPGERSELYRERSPLHAVERLARPLLILHGTADAPVPLLETFRLVDRLVRLGRPHQATIYPGETHVFTRRSTWRDAFERVEEFFARHLGSGDDG